MRTIWKYQLQEGLHNVLEVPKGARFLSIARRLDQPILYALVNPKESEVEHWSIYVVGTGNPLPDDMESRWEFLSTVVTFEGRLVWHCWKLKYE